MKSLSQVGGDLSSSFLLKTPVLFISLPTATETYTFGAEREREEGGEGGEGRVHRIMHKAKQSVSTYYFLDKVTLEQK